MADWKPGDWTCQRCNLHNFASRANCYTCKGPRPAEVKPIKKPGDWECPGCKFHNYASRDSCWKCGTAKPRKPGDWKCPSCFYTNFAHRNTCNSCYGPRYTPVRVRKPKPKEDAKDEDSTCVVCMDAAPNVVLDCGHLVLCGGCANQVTKCPMCRKIIVRRLKVYTS